MTRGGCWPLLTRESAPPVFAELLLHHLDALNGLAVRLTKNQDTAADLVQDAALRPFERFHQLRQPGAARSWLMRILTSVFLNRYAGRAITEEMTPADEPVSDETP